MYKGLTYGRTPPMISLQFARSVGPDPEPILLWDRAEVLRLTVDLCQALNRLWPDTPNPNAYNG